MSVPAEQIPGSAPPIPLARPVSPADDVRMTTDALNGELPETAPLPLAIGARPLAMEPWAHHEHVVDAGILPLAKAGAYAGKALDANGVKALASVPSKEVLLSQIAGLLKSPVQRMAAVVAALAEKRGAPAAAEAPAA